MDDYYTYNDIQITNETVYLSFKKEALIGLLFFFVLEMIWYVKSNTVLETLHY